MHQTTHAQIPHISCREECDAYLQGLWLWLEGLGTGISRDKPETWTCSHFPPSVHGIINSLGVAHEPFVWRVRKQLQLLQVRL